MSTIHVPPGAGEHYPMIDGDHVRKAVVDDPSGAFEAFEMVAPARPMAPPHVSPWTGVMYLVEGRVTAHVDGATYDVEAGAVVVFPAGTPCTFQVVGDSARFFAVTSGTGAGRFFADFSDSVPADQPPKTSMAAIRSVTQRHGVALAGG